jgi:two-component system KDP operon response regulator KdpE
VPQKDHPSVPLVLVVEDNRELRHVLRATLQAEGYEVVSTGDETEAMAKLRERRHDLLVADPPDSSDPDALATTVQQEFPDLPIIVIADVANGIGFFFGAWETSGTRRTLRKPFKLSDLIAASREAVEETVNSGP